MAEARDQPGDRIDDESDYHHGYCSSQEKIGERRRCICCVDDEIDREHQKHPGNDNQPMNAAHWFAFAIRNQSSYWVGYQGNHPETWLIGAPAVGLH